MSMICDSNMELNLQVSKKKVHDSFYHHPPQPTGQAAPLWTLQPNAIAALLVPGPSLIWNLVEYMLL